MNKAERKQYRKQLVSSYYRDNPSEGYDGMAARVNQSYRVNGNIQDTMKETGCSFGEIFEMVGFKDEIEFS